MGSTISSLYSIPIFIVSCHGASWYKAAQLGGWCNLIQGTSNMTTLPHTARELAYDQWIKLSCWYVGIPLSTVGWALLFCNNQLTAENINTRLWMRDLFLQCTYVHTCMRQSCIEMSISIGVWGRGWGRQQWKSGRGCSGCIAAWTTWRDGCGGVECWMATQKAEASLPFHVFLCGGEFQKCAPLDCKSKSSTYSQDDRFTAYFKWKCVYAITCVQDRCC